MILHPRAILLIVSLYLCCIDWIEAVSVPPTWITSSFVQANSNKVINGGPVGNSTTPIPSATMNFAPAFSSVPNLGYGISGYEGNDTMIQEQFQVWRTSLTATAFSVSIKIFGITNIWLMQIRYIAISKTFPHHLNSFDNVPVNYSNGLLSNISTASMSIKNYVNTVNYATQAGTIGSAYTQFSLPLTNNKILLFMTTLYVEGGTMDKTGTAYPLNLNADATPVSATTYVFNVSYSINSKVTKLHFSMIVFDQVDVQSSGAYLLIYDKKCYTTTGGFYPFPSQFQSNFMIGFVQFSTSKTYSSIHFNNNFVTVNGSFGAQMPTSVPRWSNTPLTRFCFTYFYMKTWTCPALKFFDINTNMCIDCPITSCLTCLNTTFCQTCDESIDYFLDATGNCTHCNLTGCLNCTSMTVCGVCDQNNQYILSGSTCQLCNASLNQFANPATQTCETCNVTNCYLCSSLYVCQTCNTTAFYYLTPSGTCAYCDPFLNQFIDPVTFHCDICEIPNCLNCSSMTTCIQCNGTANYFVNATSQCSLCAPSAFYCLQCLNMTACSNCDVLSGYALNLVTLQCQFCLLQGCINCSSTTTCAQCNTTDGYVLNINLTCVKCTGGLFFNVSSGNCEACILNNCTTCLNLTACSVCDINNSYYLLTSLTCGYCNATVDQFINASTLGCQNCSLTQCLDCSSLTTCLTCNNSAAYFLNSTDNLCYPCAVPNCLTCANLTTCAVCNTSAGYELNLTTLQCQTCTPPRFMNFSSLFCETCTLPHCSTCATLLTCSVCDYNSSYYLLTNLTCAYCDPLLDSFINSTLGCQNCSLLQCLDCINLTACLTCNTSAAYFLNSTDNLCHPCALSNCLQCATLYTCLICNQTAQYFLNASTQLCQHCSLTGCLNCTSLTVCNQCDTNNSFGFDFSSPNMSLCGTCNVSCTCDGYGLPWLTAAQTCTPICGDGLIRIGEECDDNNTIAGDGCSPLCKVEQYWVCDGAEPSHCNQTLYIPALFVDIQKAGCNSFTITAHSPDFSLDQIRPNILILNFGVAITSLVQNGSNIEITAEYSRDIVNETILLHFSPGDLLNITYSPDVPALYYSASECTGSQQVAQMLKAAEFISYGLLIVSILSCKIVGLELFGVLQLSYFTLSSHSFLNLYLEPLTKFRTFNGLNINFTPQTSQIPNNYQNMGMAGTFINNCNVMLFLLFGELLLGLTLFILAKITLSPKLKNVALRLLKQGFITLVLFNIFNIAFSAGVHWKFANPSDDSYLLSSVILFGTLASMVVAVTAMQLTAKEDYGEYKQKFKTVWICQLYVPLTVVYRAALGFYAAVRSDYGEGTLLTLGLALAFVMFAIVNLPFTDPIQNYRAGLIHLTMLFTLLTTNYYRTMKSNTPLAVKGRIYAPAIIELALIVACIAASFLVLCYEIYQLIKRFRNRKKLDGNPSVSKSNLNFNQTIETIN